MRKPRKARALRVERDAPITVTLGAADALAAGVELRALAVSAGDLSVRDRTSLGRAGEQILAAYLLSAAQERKLALAGVLQPPVKLDRAGGRA